MDKKIFRQNVAKMLNKKMNNKKISINIEKSVFNYAINEAKNKNIVRKWENKYFLQIYKNRLRSIYFNNR